MRLRSQLLLAALPLLAIPLVGYQFVGQMERFVREGLEQSVAGAARALAGALHGRRDLLAPLIRAARDPRALYVQRLAQPVAIDGYGGEWRGLPSHRLAGRQAARVRVGTRGDHLLLWIEVEDDRVVHIAAPSPTSGAGDGVLIGAAGGHGPAHRYLLATSVPGWVNARALDLPGAPIEPRIRAEWQDTATGFALEVRMPRTLAAAGLGLAVLDSDRRGEPARLAAGERDAPPRPLIFPSAALEGVLEGLGGSPGRRIRIIDRGGHIVARGGSLRRPRVAPQAPFTPLLGLLLPGPEPPGDEPADQGVARLRGADIEAALAGRPALARLARGTRDPTVLRAVHPIWLGQEVAGAVSVEESTGGVLALRRRALARLLDTTLLVFAIAAAVLLGFAALLTWRIARLRDRAEKAFDADGRVVGRLSAPRAADELGDLGRSLARLIERLAGYTGYLEQLAGRLSHELRTPLAVVRSSLEGLAEAPSAEATSRYLDRARGGLERLESTLGRMSEAARLEHTLADAERERFDLRALLEAAVAGYAQAWPEPGFRLALPPEPCPVEAAPELLVQMLDKLIENARDFHRDEGPIEVELRRVEAGCEIVVRNRGAGLPEAMRPRLFDSLISVRPGGARRPHLGLGLHVVRLIAEHHGARATLRDHDGGVEAVVRLPTASAPPAGRGGRRDPGSASG